MKNSKVMGALIPEHDVRKLHSIMAKEGLTQSQAIRKAVATLNCAHDGVGR